jgi:histidinol-phosphatase (PHP family)
MEELGQSGACDVYAHPDLVKVAGHVPAVPDEFYDRIAEAAASSGLAAEVSSAGWRKPVGEEYPAPPLLRRFVDRGVPLTTASDAHSLPDVAHRAGDLRSLLAQVGVTELRGFRERRPHDVPVDDGFAADGGDGAAVDGSADGGDSAAVGGRAADGGDSAAAGGPGGA